MFSNRVTRLAQAAFLGCVARTLLSLGISAPSAFLLLLLLLPFWNQPVLSGYCRVSGETHSK